MTTTTSPRHAGPTATTDNDRPAQGSTTASDRPEPRRRGTLVIEKKVVEKIAGQAASEIGASRGRSGGLLGIGSEADADARPKVEVELSENFADLAIEAGIAYPGSIRRASQQIRDLVSRRVQDLTGISVHRVDIDVTFLTVRTDDHAAGRGAPSGPGNHDRKLR